MKRSFLPQTLSLFLIALFIITSCNNNQKQTPPYTVINPDSVKGHIIDIAIARDYTKSFREERTRLDSMTQGKFLAEQFNLANAQSLNRDVFALLLEQKDKEGNLAAGIRIYNGRKYNEALKRYEVTVVLVPYDRKGNDIVNKLAVQTSALKIPGIKSANAQNGGGDAIDNAPRCPEACDDGGSGLNGPGGPQ